MVSLPRFVEPTVVALHPTEVAEKQDDVLRCSKKPRECFGDGLVERCFHLIPLSSSARRRRKHTSAPQAAEPCKPITKGSDRRVLPDWTGKAGGVKAWNRCWWL